MTITDLQDKVAHLNTVAEVLINLNNSDPENRRLAKYDYAKMNLTSAIKLEQVEKEIENYQEQMNLAVDDYEYRVRRLEKSWKILYNNINNEQVFKKRKFKFIL